MRLVHVHHDNGVPIVWGGTFWLPPTEGHDHPVFMGGYDQEMIQTNPVAGNGHTVVWNVFNRLRRYRAAGVPLLLRRGHVVDTCGCTACARLELLACATVARHEGRMETYFRLLGEL